MGSHPFAETVVVLFQVLWARNWTRYFLPPSRFESVSVTVCVPAPSQFQYQPLPRDRPKLPPTLSFMKSPVKPSMLGLNEIFGGFSEDWRFIDRSNGMPLMVPPLHT